MKQKFRASALSPLGEPLSNPRFFRATVEWDPNFPVDLVIYPLGGSDERDEQIRKTLKKAFAKLQADHAGIQNVAI